MDLAEFAGEDFLDLELAGKTYRILELTLREWATVQAWIKAKVPGPLASLASPDFKTLPPDVKRDVLAEALQQDRTSWPPRVGSKAWLLALDHDGGHAVLLKAILGKAQPLEPGEVERLVEAVKFEEILPAVVAALGMFGPKSPAPAETTTTMPTGAKGTTTSATSRTSSRRRGAGRGKTSSD